MQLVIYRGVFVFSAFCLVVMNRMSKNCKNVFFKVNHWMLNKDKPSINSARDRKKGESQEGRETKRKGRGKVNIFFTNFFSVGGKNGKYKFFNMLK